MFKEKIHGLWGQTDKQAELQIPFTSYSLKLEMSLKLPWLITQQVTASCLASKYSMIIPPFSPSSLKAQLFPKVPDLRM